MSRLTWVNLLVFVSRKAHTVWRVKIPVAVCVRKVDLVDDETHRERSILTKVVVLVAYMNTLDVQLNSIEEVSDEAEADWLFELANWSLIPLILEVLHAFVTRGLLFCLRLLGLLSLFASFLAALFGTFAF